MEFQRDGRTWRVGGEAAALLAGALDDAAGQVETVWDDVQTALSCPRESVLTDAMAAVCVALRDGEMACEPPLEPERARALRRGAALALRLWEAAESDVAADTAQAVRAAPACVDLAMRSVTREEFEGGLRLEEWGVTRQGLATALGVLERWVRAGSAVGVAAAPYWQKQLAAVALPGAEAWAYSRGVEAVAKRLARTVGVLTGPPAAA